METPKLSLMGHVTLAILAALIIESVLYFWISVAQIPGGPDPSSAYWSSPFITFGVVLFLLVWAEQKVGFLGALIYGIVSFITGIVGVADIVANLESQSLSIVVPGIILSLVLVWSSWVAWKE